jgi:hypothetical protein
MNVGGLYIIHKLSRSIRAEKKYKLGIVPHYMDENDERIAEMCQEIKNSCVISVHLSPTEFIERLSECECILSTAMHPLIAADVLGIPNLWVYLPEGNGEDISIKVNDYYSVYGIEKKPYIWEKMNKNIVSYIWENYDIKHDKVMEIIDDIDNAYGNMLSDIRDDWVLRLFTSVRYYLLYPFHTQFYERIINHFMRKRSSIMQNR